MGMYDIVIVEYQLPDEGAVAVNEWQTKDFDGLRRNLKITADGRLMREIVRYEDRSDHNAPVGSFARTRGSMTPVHERWIDMNYGGVLNFYGVTRDATFDYNAKFVNGKLVEITRGTDWYA